MAATNEVLGLSAEDAFVAPSVLAGRAGGRARAGRGSVQTGKTKKSEEYKGRELLAAKRALTETQLLRILETAVQKKAGKLTAEDVRNLRHPTLRHIGRSNHHYRVGDHLLLFAEKDRATLRKAYWALCTQRFGHNVPKNGSGGTWTSGVAEERIAMVLNERYRQRVQPAA
jgi:hypothetical protein